MIFQGNPNVNYEDNLQIIQERFRGLEEMPAVRVDPGLSQESGFFRLNSDTVCFGQSSSGRPAQSPTGRLHLASEHIKVNGTSLQLPVNPTQIIDNLRLERYTLSLNRNKGWIEHPAIRRIYYLLRPFMPITIRKHFQRAYFNGWNTAAFPHWPVDCTVENIFEYLLALMMKVQGITELPFIWFWPDGAPSATIMTHDVETTTGLDFCERLMDLNDSFGVKASLQFVPEKRYKIPQELLAAIRTRGFEVNVHDLNHDGRLFHDYNEFLLRAQRIRRYKAQFQAEGFRSAVLYRNVDWYEALDFSYDMSIPNVAHLDPQRGGCCTIFPFFIGDTIELPVTTTQDYSLFHVLNEYSVDLWKEQMAIIRKRSGLMSFIIHPDYIVRERARSVYRDLLSCLSELQTNGQTWIALPREVATWWRMRNQMTLVYEQGAWQVRGQGSGRARVARAVLAGENIRYELD